MSYLEFHFLKTSLISCEYKRNSASKQKLPKVQSWNPKTRRGRRTGNLSSWGQSKAYSVQDQAIQWNPVSKANNSPPLTFFQTSVKFHLKSNIFWIFHTKLLHTKITVYSFLIIKYLVLSTPIKKMLENVHKFSFSLKNLYFQRHFFYRNL